jgi:uncharacterized membrane protein YwaF
LQLSLLSLPGDWPFRDPARYSERVWKVLNLFAEGVAIFDFVFKTNYMYLCAKPASRSLLDYFGPWPAYIHTGEVFALGIFWLLWLPLGIRADPSPSRD